MIELVIKIVNGEPFEHPITRQNFEQVWPELDFENLPPEFARFRRIPRPVPGVYEIVEGCEYQWNGDLVEDHWTIRPMDSYERIVKQTYCKETWEGPTSWVFNEETCEFDPPVAYPTDGNKYVWDENILNWVMVDQ
jgi:hypothetical protein